MAPRRRPAQLPPAVFDDSAEAAIHLVRLGPSPLATTFADCCEAAVRLERIMVERTYEQFSTQRALVS